jgi:uncharacterized protein
MTTPDALPTQPEQTAPEPYPFWGWEDVAVFFGLGVPCLVLSLLVVQAFLYILPWKNISKAFLLLPAQFVGYGMWFASLVFLLRVKYDKPFWKSLAWVMPQRRFVVRAIFSGPLLAFYIGFIAWLLNTPQIEMPFRDLLTDRASIIMTGIFAVVLGPLCEELAFRGFLLPVLMRSFGRLAGIFLSALPFALLHGPEYSWSWKHITLIAIAGMAFGWVRYRTGSTAAATITHATYNLTQFTAFVVSRGQEW